MHWRFTWLERLGASQKSRISDSFSLRPSVYLCGLCVEMTVKRKESRDKQTNAETTRIHRRLRTHKKAIRGVRSFAAAARNYLLKEFKTAPKTI